MATRIRIGILIQRARITTTRTGTRITLGTDITIRRPNRLATRGSASDNYRPIAGVPLTLWNGGPLLPVRSTLS